MSDFSPYQFGTQAQNFGDLNSSMSAYSEREYRGPGPGGGDASNNKGRGLGSQMQGQGLNQYQQAYMQHRNLGNRNQFQNTSRQQAQGEGWAAGEQPHSWSQTNVRGRGRGSLQGSQIQNNQQWTGKQQIRTSPPFPQEQQMRQSPSLRHQGHTDMQRGSNQQQPTFQKNNERPYMMFVYSQKFKVAGQGEYEIKITNVINPYTMKATPLQPSLIDPTYMMAQGIGSSKKTLTLQQEDHSSHMRQKQDWDDFQNQGTRAHQTNKDRNVNHQRNSFGGPINQVSQLKKGSNTGRSKLTSGAQVRMLACSRLYQNAAKKVSGVLQIAGATKQRNFANVAANAIDIQSQEQIREKRKEIGAKLLKKFMNSKLRESFVEVKMKSWQVYKYREQQKKKRGLQLFKFVMMLKDKQKNNKFFAMSKLKENHLSQYQERSSGGGLDSQNNSKSNPNSQSQSYVKTHNPQEIFISQAPTTAGQSFSQQAVHISLPVAQPLTAQEIQRRKDKAVQLLFYALNKKVRENKFYLYLTLRTLKLQTKAYVKELKIDFGSQKFDRTQLEEELAKRFNKIEIKKVTTQNPNLLDDSVEQAENYKNFMRNEQLVANLEDTIDFEDGSKFIDQGLFLNQQSCIEDTFIQELHQLESHRSRTAQLSAETNKNLQKKTAAEIKNFSPLFDPDINFINSSPYQKPRPYPLIKETKVPVPFKPNPEIPQIRQIFPQQTGSSMMDQTSFMVTEEDVKTIKIENNLVNLNQDIRQVNEEIEQIKRLLFQTTEPDYLPLNDEEDIDFQFIENGRQFNQYGTKRQVPRTQLMLGDYRESQQFVGGYDDQLSFTEEDEIQNFRMNRNQFNLNMNSSQIYDSDPKQKNPRTGMPAIVPASKINNRFRSEEDMIKYYELKALDIDDDKQIPQQLQIQTSNYGQVDYQQMQRNLGQNYQEENKYYEDEIDQLINQHIKKQTSHKPMRDRTDSIKKNILKYEKSRPKNLNDSRENDFEGFDDDDLDFI